jgi:hypothetical protein
MSRITVVSIYTFIVARLRFAVDGEAVAKALVLC